MQTRLGWTIPFLAIGLLGCGNYTVIFKVQDVINTGGRGDTYAKLLDIDIVCLAPSDAEDNPRLARGSIGSAAWFLSREQGAGGENITLEACRIFALRGSKSTQPNEVSIYDDYSDDTPLDRPLRGVSDGGAAELDYKIHHPHFNSDKSVLLIYGRFHDGQGGLKDNAPIRISPPKKWNTDVIVKVGRERLDLVPQD